MQEPVPGSSARSGGERGEHGIDGPRHEGPAPPGGPGHGREQDTLEGGHDGLGTVARVGVPRAGDDLLDDVEEALTPLREHGRELVASGGLQGQLEALAALAGLLVVGAASAFLVRNRSERRHSGTALVPYYRTLALGH